MSNIASPSLQIKTDINEILKADATRQDAAFFVTPVGFDATATVQPPRLAAVILDISVSMKGAKIQAAVEGACAFLDAMLKSPQNYVAVYLFGSSKHRLFHPALATPQNIEAAKHALRQKLPALEGSTQTAGGLQLFREDYCALAKAGKVTEGFAGLLTDGDYGDRVSVGEELVAYQGLAKQGQILRVLARGVGTDWEMDKLRLISDGTGSAPPVVLANPSEVKADFEGMVAQAASQALSGVTMVIQKFNMGDILDIAVRSPVSLDLENACSKEGEKFIRVNLGSWDAETRLFYLAFEVARPSNAPAVMAAKIWFEYKVGGQLVKSDPFPIKAQWARNSEEASLSQRVTRGVKVAQGIEGSQRRMREAGDLLKGGNTRGASDILGDLVKTAHEDGDIDLLEQLKEFVEILDAATGKVKLKNTDAATGMKINAGSSVRRTRAVAAPTAAPADTTAAAATTTQS
ncbi:MAG: hypothetical protein P4L53_09325 [Candidatus Obscuribacterales bacterium]|nr:hypothetical protein [Candidatus Obscuribacterales bacterium]